jgi:AP-1 complex subunit mu
VFIIHSSLYFFVVTRRNSNNAVLLVFLDLLAKLLEDYLSADLCADAIIGNFALVSELLDEVMDYGYPQTLDLRALSGYVLREKPKNPPKDFPINATLFLTWHPEGIEYHVNEVFVDVIEYISLLVGKNGAVIQHEVNLTCYLSGIPELGIGLNDNIIFDQTDDQARQTDVTRRVFELHDMKFHQCVKLSQYERDRSITFILPNEKFNLLKYRLSAVPPEAIKKVQDELVTPPTDWTSGTRAAGRTSANAELFLDKHL